MDKLRTIVESDEFRSTITLASGYSLALRWGNDAIAGVLPLDESVRDTAFDRALVLFHKPARADFEHKHSAALIW